MAKTIKLLNALPRTKAIKLHGSVFQQRGSPDIFGVNFSHPFVVEMKTELGKLSDIQKKRLAEWYEAGVRCIVSTEPIEVLRLVASPYGNWAPRDLLTP